MVFNSAVLADCPDSPTALFTVEGNSPMNRTTLIPAAAALALLLGEMGQAKADVYPNETIEATANIFGSGNAGSPTPAPGGGGGGTAAPGFAISPGTGRVLTFQSVTGMVSLTPGYSVLPDGLQTDGTPPFGASTNITSYQGISGISLDLGSGFLIGVFVSAATPSDPAPTSLGFTNNGTGGLIDTGFSTLSPALDQTFFIGDGLTGFGTGATQQFNVPDSATQLFLGFADGYGYSGAPGQYQDNSGAFVASFEFSPDVPEPSNLIMLTLPIIGMLVYLRRRRVAQVAA